MDTEEKLDLLINAVAELYNNVVGYAVPPAVQRRIDRCWDVANMPVRSPHEDEEG